MNVRDILTQLAQPFPVSALQWRAGSVTRDKTKAMALAYVDPREYEKRLDEVCPEWSVHFTPWNENRVICNLTVNGITRSSTGESSGDDFAPGTSAEAQAFKRACSKFGLGRYLYDLPAPWVAYDPQKKKLLETPRLPNQPAPAAPAAPAPTADNQPLTKERAQAMHKELGKLGHANALHYHYASHVTGREITSLTQLTDLEARRVYHYAKTITETPHRTVSDEEAAALIN